MKGKIEITVPMDKVINIKGDIEDLNETARVLIFSCLAEAMELTEIERRMIGAIIWAGGIEALGGPPATSFRIASELAEAVERIKNRKENNNETDAL